jgi:RNA polymerase sigma-70 factor (ECF subfamily)
MTAVQAAPAGAPSERGGKPSDHSLLRRFRLGSQDAATQLYLRYAGRLRALTEAQRSPDLAWCVEVDDIIESVFGSFFRGAGRGYYDVPPGEDLWKLFLVIALNKIRAKATYFHAAKRDARRTVNGEAARRSLEACPAPGDSEYAFLELAIDEVLGRLPPQHREMVQLRVEGFAVAEIAGRTGRSRRTVERLLQESRQKLDGLLREEGLPCSRG